MSDSPDPVPSAGLDPLSVGDWVLRVPEGLDFGPVPAAELRAWVAAGRVDAKCQLREAKDGVWRPAESLIPALQHAPPRLAASAGGANAPAAPPPGLVLRPHRGTYLMLLAVVSWVSCPLLGFAAWWMASHDLAQIRAGRVDPAGAASAQAAQIVGLTHAIVALLVILVGMFFGLVGWLSRS